MTLSSEETVIRFKFFERYCRNWKKKDLTNSPRIHILLHSIGGGFLFFLLESLQRCSTYEYNVQCVTGSLLIIIDWCWVSLCARDGECRSGTAPAIYVVYRFEITTDNLSFYHIVRPLSTKAHSHRIRWNWPFVQRMAEPVFRSIQVSCVRLCRFFSLSIALWDLVMRRTLKSCFNSLFSESIIKTINVTVINACHLSY